MVALKSAQVSQFVASPANSYTAVLLHGTDLGLVSERAELIASNFSQAQNEPSEILRMDDSDLADDPDRPVVELRTLPMFGGPKVLRLKAGPRLKPALIDDLLAPGTIQGLLLVEAGNLKRDAKIRKLFEASKSAAAIACYSDDSASLGRMIDDVLGAQQLTLSPEGRTHLISLLGADRALSRAEVEKLAVFGRGRKELTVDDVDAVVGDVAEQTLDRVVFAAMGGQADPAVRELDRSVAAGQPPQAVLLALQRHLAKLHRARAQIDAGKSADAAIRGLRPPVHFKQQAAFQKQCRDWSMGAIERALLRTQRTVALTRRNPALEEALTGELLLEIARLGTASAGKS
ncbi:MAG: DNA polymerase III subunit delta [Hyphomicrobiaceae bacterium]